MGKSKSRLALVLAGVGALALVFSGCFVLAGINFSRLSIKPHAGKNSKTTLTVTTHSDDTDHVDNQFGSPYDRRRGVVWFLIGLPEDNSIKPFGKPKFDTTQQMGKTKKLVKDNAMRNALVDAETCMPDGGMVSTNYWAYRTASKVKDREKPAKPVLTKFVLKSVAKLTAYENPASVLVGSGWWVDDGDGDFDPDDEVACTGYGLPKIYNQQGPLPRNAPRPEVPQP